MGSFHMTSQASWLCSYGSGRCVGILLRVVISPLHREVAGIPPCTHSTYERQEKKNHSLEKLEMKMKVKNINKAL